MGKMNGEWITCDRQRDKREGIVVRYDEKVRDGRAAVAKIDQVEEREREREGERERG